MPLTFPALRLTGAQILRDGSLRPGALSLEGGRIAARGGTEVDLAGYLVLPGIVDLHGDAFERHLRPRPRVDFGMAQGLLATDRDAAANGVTTAWLAQSWSWEGGHRSPDFAERMLAALAEARPRLQTDLRVQIRCETYMTATLERLVEAVRAHGVDYVVFNNHLDEALALVHAQDSQLGVYAKSVGRSAEDYARTVREAKKQAAAVPRFLCSLAAAFDRMNVLYGSHDDRDAETRETYSMIGAKICEFPLSRAVAKLAKAVNDPVLMGAPNVVRGGSQNGNVSARALIEAGCCDALVSDYCYPTMARAAFELADWGVLSLAEAWAMISTRPAQILRLADRGLITEGRRADLAIVNAETHEVEATLVEGRVTHLSGEAARRFLAAPERLSMAAE
ncbi:MAG: alpha-D-ribose 1-methylphosphonate 5-triphosphate diphosphatase [Roseovarius sp.]